MAVEGDGDHRITTVRYRLYPNATQRGIMEETLVACRKVYNMQLRDCIEDALENGRYDRPFAIEKKVKGIVMADPTLKVAYNSCLREVTARVYRAMRKCRWNVDGDPEHLPKYKTDEEYCSFTYLYDRGYGFNGNRLVLKKIGEVKYRNDHHPKDGLMRACTVKREADGKWYAFIVYKVPNIVRTEIDFDNLPTPEGYDLGLRDLITDTRGVKVSNPSFLTDDLEKIGKLQSRLRRYEKGTEEWLKCKNKLAVEHLKIRKKRDGFVNHLAHQMIEGHDVIVLERMSPKAVKENCSFHTMRRQFIDASWGKLRSSLLYKAAKAGVHIIEVDPSGTRVCGLILDRDTNAARNILKKGLGTKAYRLGW